MFDERKARRVTGFIECLKHTKGEFHGKPFKLLPWQEKIIRDVFGTVRDDDPTMRQYTTAYIEIPKKQGKSELGAAIALNMLANPMKGASGCYGAVSKWLKLAMRGSAFFRSIFGQAKTECRKNGTQGIIFIRNFQVE